MKTEVKNTLYRFVTMRAPELLEKKEVDAAFVQHPEIKDNNESYDSEFLESLNPIPDGKTKKQALQEKALDFVDDAIKSRDKVRTDYTSEAFYDFAIWLTKNRTTFELKEVDEWMDKHKWSTNKPPTKIIELWDNLFYQIITFKSNYVRDAIISILVADFFIRNYDSKAGVENARFLAQARVIIPKFMFEAEVDSASESKKGKENLKGFVNTKELEKANELLVIKNLKSQLESIKKALVTVEKKYKIEVQKALNAYNKQYDIDKKAAYDAATPVEITYTDPVTNKVTKYTEYENLELPEYDFQPIGELEYCVDKSFEESIFYQFADECKNELLFSTFKEVYDLIDEKSKELTTKQFQRTTTSKRVANVNGVVLSTSDGSTSYARTSYSFTLKTLIDGNGNKYLVLSFGNMEAGTVIESGSYSITFGVSGGETTISGDFINATQNSVMNSNGVLEVSIFNYSDHYFTAPEVCNFTIAGRFISSAQRVLNITDGKGHVRKSTRDLSAAYSDPFVSTQYTTSNNNYVADGGGTYTYEDAVSGATGSTGSTDTDGSASSGTVPGTAGSTPPNPSNLQQNVISYIPSGYGIKRLGIADYRKVEQEICCYVPGEVSHIENVMAREYKEKATRRLRRQEDTITTSKEKETEKLTDTTSTDRFEMNQEVSSVLSEQNSFAAGSQISWSGLISGNAHADFAHNTSQETSNNQAVINAQEVTERVLERVVQKVKEERITKIIEEFEETSKHGYDNRKGDKHISGVYRWVDKIYKNKVVNYGKRLMYEFMIPEPAVFHNMAIEYKANNNEIEELIKPLDPRTVSGDLAMKSYLDVKAENYLHWASIYNTEVEQMPDDVILIGSSFSFEKESADGLVERYTKNEMVKINDQRYIAKYGKAVMIAHEDTGGNPHLASVTIGDKYNGTIAALRGVLKLTLPIGTSQNAINVANTANEKLLSLNFDYQPIGDFKNEVPVSVQFYNYHVGTVNVSIKCQLNPEAKKQWQKETFNAIISAYEDRLKEYNDKLAELKSVQVQKVKMNPLFYRQIENTILRKNCIEYMISHEALGKDSFLTGTSSLDDVRAKYDDPNLESYAAKVKFFEQAFEWNLMSYYFYPFYWAKSTNWKSLYNVDEVDDPVFRAFLQSGMARVIITVRPGFEEAVNWYMATGQIWNGGQVPTVNDPLFVAIVKELQKPEGEVEQTWESRVPTSLTVIQAGTIGLNVEGLPCDDECEDNLQFDSDGNAIKVFQQSVDEEGNPVQMGNITDELETVSDSIDEIKTDIEEIKTTLNGMSGGN